MDNKLLLFSAFIKRRRLLAIAVFLILLFLVNIIPIPYYSISPGPHLNVANLIKVPTNKNHKVSNKIFMVTVNITHLNLGLFLFTLLNRKAKIVSTKDLLGPSPPSNLQSQGLEQMKSSKLDAKAAAFRYLGYHVPENGSGVSIVEVVPHSAAKLSNLQPGQTIVSYQGKKVGYAQQLISYIQSSHPNQVVNLGIKGHNNKLYSIKVRLGQNPSHKNSAFLGVAVVTLNKQFRFPFSIQIKTSNIGGPSAGLAFTLGIIDKLDPKKFPSHFIAAATGTITSTGQVGPIGGIEQKTFSIDSSKSSLFLVPNQNYKTSHKYARSNLKVVAISTLSQAVTTLNSSVAHSASPSASRAR